MNLPNINKRKVYIYSAIVFTAITILAGLLFTGLYYTNKFFEQNTFKFQSPVKFHKPIWIEKRPVAIHSPFFSEASAQAIPPEYADPKEQMIFDKFSARFGEKVGHEAVAVSWAENGTRVCDRVGVNKDKSWDIGVFQINSVHLKRFKLEQLVGCESNVDVAVQIYSEQKWNPWVAYNNGNWKKYPQLADKLK